MHHRDEDLPARSDAVGLVLELVRPQLEEMLENQEWEIVPNAKQRKRAKKTLQENEKQ